MEERREISRSAIQMPLLGGGEESDGNDVVSTLIISQLNTAFHCRPPGRLPSSLLPFVNDYHARMHAEYTTSLQDLIHKYTQLRKKMIS